MSHSHEANEQQSNWETKIVCECGERCTNWMEFHRHRGDAYRAQVQNRDAVLTAFDDGSFLAIASRVVERYRWEGKPGAYHLHAIEGDELDVALGALITALGADS